MQAASFIEEQWGRICTVQVMVCWLGDSGKDTGKIFNLSREQWRTDVSRDDHDAFTINRVTWKEIGKLVKMCMKTRVTNERNLYADTSSEQHRIM